MQPFILIPFDFSAASDRALAWAADLHGSVGGGALHVLHTLNPLPAGAAVTGVVTPVFSEEDLARVEGALKDAVAKHSTEATVEVVVAPDAGQAILAVARRRQVDLIAMGTHGRGGLTRAVLGSVADFIVRHAECAVVTVRAARARS